MLASPQGLGLVGYQIPVRVPRLVLRHVAVVTLSEEDFHLPSVTRLPIIVALRWCYRRSSGLAGRNHWLLGGNCGLMRSNRFGDIKCPMRLNSLLLLLRGKMELGVFHILGKRLVVHIRKRLDDVV